MNNHRQLQVLMHKIGVDAFKGVLIDAAFNASEDTSDFEDKSISKKWQDLAQKLSEAFNE